MKKIYFVGIKGVGMTPLALIAKQSGAIVAGSDTDEKFITDKSLKQNDIPVSLGFKAENIQTFFQNTPKEDSLLIYSAAHNGSQNIEVQQAKKENITTITQGEAVGWAMDGKMLGKNQEGISVAGTHGKTTTSALLAYLLTTLNTDPSYLIGSSEIYPLGDSGHFGHGKYFVAEADEYVADMIEKRTSKFLSHFPKYIILTNIDFDHPDVFENIHDIKKAFLDFLANLPEDGIAIINIDDKNTLEIMPQINQRYITFGKHTNADYQIIDFKEGSFGASFTLRQGNKEYKCQLSLSGIHNAENAAAALACIDTLGLSLEKAIKNLKNFKGTKRRSEELGTTPQGAIVIDDYAHHPKEIQTTLHALKEKYGKKVVAVFQPHTFSRTNALMSEFSTAFSDADTLVLLPIFKSAREDEDKKGTEEKYVAEMQSKNNDVIFLPNHDAVLKYLAEKEFNKNYIIVTVGAGDVYRIAEKLVLQKTIT